MMEIEAKIKVEKDILLRKLGKDFKLVYKENVYDIYFDSPVFNLSKDDRLLRLRRQGSKVFIAYKGPRQDSRLTEREEIETEMSDFDIGLKFISALGFSPIAKAEKERAEYVHKEFPGLKVQIDSYPFIGDYVEIEGPRDKVLNMIRSLGFDESEVIKKNCTEIFLDFCKQENVKVKDPRLYFTFYDEKNGTLSLGKGKINKKAI